MLNFFRKHQKYFFIVITAAIVVSFCFFGTYGAMGQEDSPVDKEIGKGVCGKPMMQLEIASLSRLISSSALDRNSWEKEGMPNFLNDGVVEKDFLSNGLGVMLAQGYFDQLKEDLDQRIKKIHHFRPYVHPRSSLISVEGAWARFSPDLLQRFKMLKSKSDQLTTETFALMSQLYVDQAMVPPDILKQILMMQQNQLGVAPDPLLANSDLALFGFKSMEDWFGPKFVSLLSQFILNAAQIAEERGYQVKTEEVRAELIQNIIQGYQQISKETHLSSEDVNHYFQTKSRSLGLDEAGVIHIWKKVMLFRRLFEDASSSILLDPLAYQQFDKYAKENARISLYQLPTSLHFADFRSMMKFQIYLEAVAQDPSGLRKSLHLPAQFATLEQIEKRAPELVEKKFEIQWSTVSKEDLGKTISVKQTWNWESSALNWEKLQKNFPELAHLNATTDQLRIDALKNLDEKLRMKIDQFARAQMIEEQPEQIRSALHSAPVDTANVAIKMKGGQVPLFGKIEVSDELVALLQNASLKSESPNEAAQRLSFYSPDGNHFFCIQVLNKDAAKKVSAFADAVADGSLDRLLDKKLEEAYPDVRKKDPRYFQQNDGQWKPFKEVKDQIGRHYFADLLKTIEAGYRTYYGILPGKEGELPLAFYGNARLLTYMSDAAAILPTNPSSLDWVRSEQNADDFATQWLLEKKVQVVDRSMLLGFSKDEIFTLKQDQWSKVKMGERGALALYCILEKGESFLPPVRSVEQGHQILSYDAKRDLMQQVMQRVHHKKAIDLSSIIARDDS